MDIDVTEHEKLKIIIRMLMTNYGKSLTEVIKTFIGHNYEIRLAGEMARDIIMRKLPKTLELVSSASLYQMRRLLTKKNIPITIDEKGATVTLLYHSYKIGTIWPVVEESTKSKSPGVMKAYWMMNAYQRIFSVDSNSIDFNGTIYDYYNAREDISNCHVRVMATDPDTLFKNNYLTIFKYFRLYVSLTRSGRCHDEKTLKSILANIKLLANIKGELIWSEFKTILLHPKRYECVKSFLECGGGAFLGLPENLKLFEFGEIARHSDFANHPLLAVSYMCAFLETPDDVMRLHERLRLSAYERDPAIFRVKYKAVTRQIDDLMYYRQMCSLRSGKNRQICREYAFELLKYHNKTSLFENLLVNPSSSCIVDPLVLYWKRIHLKGTKIDPTESTNGTNDFAHEQDGNASNESPIGNKLSALKCASSKKKQKLQ